MHVEEQVGGLISGLASDPCHLSCHVHKANSYSVSLCCSGCIWFEEKFC